MKSVQNFEVDLIKYEKNLKIKNKIMLCIVLLCAAVVINSLILLYLVLDYKNILT
jgi:hypothetical protein